KASNYAEATTAIHSVIVVDEGAQVDALLQLPMNETALDQSVNHFSTQLSGGVFTAGPTAEAFEALRLSSVSDELLVVNHDLLNFRDEIGMSLWVYFTDFSEERFLISHGSWEKRWKLSTTENKKLRWTVNTSDGIKDLDSSIELESDRWYYVAVAYDGHSMQLYLDGELDAFSLQSGQINQSDVGISIGKRLPGDDQYNLRGTIDEVRLYNQSFDPDQVATLMNQWSPKVITGFSFKENMIYPNPASSYVNITVVSGSDIEIYNLGGLKIKSIPTHQAGYQTITLELTDFVEGIYLVRVSNTQPFQKLVIRK
ncbi:MAG: LamG-like jellyroll fold domain-containing protein, partial [Marinoscillum sp.]